MKARETYYWWGGAAVVAGIIVAAQLWPLPDAAARIARLSPAGVWHRSVPVELAPWEREFFRRAAVVKRMVAVQQERVVLTVIDGSHNRQAVHDPEFCFRGAGWTVEATTEVPIGSGRARLLRLRKGATTAEALFWFSDGEVSFSAPWRYWIAATWRRLTFGQSGADPVLVLLTSLDDRPPRWQSLLDHWPDLARL
jgi:hypothetical protein